MSEQNPFWQDLNGAVFGEQIAPYQMRGQGHLSSFYCTSDLAEASIGLAGTALARYCGVASDTVTVDRRLASLWFDMTLRPDGWIRLHTNARHHRDAALRVLNVAVDRDAVREAVLAWRGIELETAIVTAGGCASFMRTAEEWAQHPQGRVVASNPLVHWETHGSCAPRSRPEKISLAGLKVLDLTRVLAGPVATRFFGGLWCRDLAH